MAEFLKSPLRAVLSGRLGVAIEGYRDRELDADSPLGVSSGPAEWKLEGATLDGDDGFERLFRQMQLAGELPAGFIGDFAKESLVAGLSDSLDVLREFAESFGVKKGVDLASLTSRQRVPAMIKPADGKSVKVQYVAETPNWTESEDGVSVLVTGYLKEVSERSRPIDRTLAPFIAFLMHLTDGAYADIVTPQTLRVGVIDIANGTTASWRWSVVPAEAKDYLEELTLHYRDFLGATKRPSRYKDFTYRKLAKALEWDQDCDWNGILERLTAKEWHGNAKKKSFNNALVVELALEECRCDPTAEELKDLYEKFYSLPMSGKLDDAGMGGAQ